MWPASRKRAEQSVRLHRGPSLLLSSSSTNSNDPRTRLADLSISATDAEWSHGSGANISGPVSRSYS
jgi:hypothetical protein